jgi:hypothetical protein
MFKERIKNRAIDQSKRTHNASELASIAQVEWEKIDGLEVDRLIESMPRRVQTVIKRSGGHLKY